MRVSPWERMTCGGVGWVGGVGGCGVWVGGGVLKVRARVGANGGGRQREAEGGRGRQREAEGGRGRQREAKASQPASKLAS